MGLAGLGRYGKEPRPHVQFYGAAFEVEKKEKSAGYVGSSFQTKDGDARTKALNMARTKANMTAARFTHVIAECGFQVKAEMQEEKIVHSEQYPVRIPLDKEGNVADKQDHTGRLLPNLYLDELAPRSASLDTPRSRHDSVNSPSSIMSHERKLSVTPPMSPPLSSTKLNSQPPQPIPALAPSERNDALGYSDMEPTSEDEHFYSQYIIKRIPLQRMPKDVAQSSSRAPSLRAHGPASQPLPLAPPMKKENVSSEPSSRKRKSTSAAEESASQSSKRPKLDQSPPAPRQKKMRLQDPSSKNSDKGPIMPEKVILPAPQSSKIIGDTQDALTPNLSSSNDPLENSTQPQVVTPQQHAQQVDDIRNSIKKDYDFLKQSRELQKKKKHIQQANDKPKRPEMQRYTPGAKRQGAPSSNVQAARGNPYNKHDGRSGRDQRRRDGRNH
jgi:hypothetical protein